MVSFVVTGLFLSWQAFSAYLQVAYPTDFSSSAEFNFSNTRAISTAYSAGATSEQIVLSQSPQPAASLDLTAVNDVVLANLQQLTNQGLLKGPKGDTGATGPRGSAGHRSSSSSTVSISTDLVGDLVTDVLNTPGDILLPILSGGLGLDVLPDVNQLLVGTGSGYALTTLFSGNNLDIINNAGTLSFDTVATPTFESLHLTQATDQLVFGSVVTGILSWQPSGGDKILTLPDVSDTLVGRDTSDVLSNKTIAAVSNIISGLTNANLSGNASISNANLANSSFTLSLGTGLSGSATFALGDTISLTNTGVTSLVGTTDQVNISGSTGSVSLSLPQSIGPASSPTFAAINGLTLTAASDGLTISGGTASRSITVSGGNIVLSGGGHTLTLGGDVSVDQSLSIGSSPTFGGLTLSNNLTLAGNINGNNTMVTSGTLANTALSGTCVLNVNASGLAAFQSSATITNTQIFYNSTSNRHSRITTVNTCTDNGGNPWRIVTLSDSISGNSSGDSYTVYQNNTSLGTTASGFIGTINAVNLKGLVSTLTGGFDVAEQYSTNDTDIEPGEVVSIDPAQPNKIKRSITERDPYLLGVISSNPALTLGGEDIVGWKNVALAGRVPVKVIGPVKPGDYLTSSDIAGVAKKATRAGNVIGRALEAYDSDQVGRIMIFVMTGQTLGSIAEDEDDPLTPVFEKILTEHNTNPSIVSADAIVAETIGSLSLAVDKVTAVTGTALRIDSDVNLLGRINFDPDTGGKVNLAAGETSVEVVFHRKFPTVPIVTASFVNHVPLDIMPGFSLTNISESGFTIELFEPLTTDLAFNWLALSVKREEQLDSQ